MSSNQQRRNPAVQCSVKQGSVNEIVMFPSGPFDFFYAPDNPVASTVMNMTISLTDPFTDPFTTKPLAILIIKKNVLALISAIHHTCRP
jgi:hypothetical protein